MELHNYNERFNSHNSAKQLNVTHLLPYSPIHLFTSKKVAFTLAEVLITLGIIGVVAAITLPTLIHNIQDRQFIAKWKKEYSVINNAFMQIEFENGVTITPYAGFSVETQQKFKERLNVINCKAIYDENDSICPKEERSKRGSWYTATYKSLGREGGLVDYNFNQTALLLNDGTLLKTGGSLGGPWIVVDVNNSAGPNEVGRDVYIIKVIQKSNQHRLVPLGVDGTFDKTSNGNTCECSKDKGAASANFIAGPNGSNRSTEIIRGGCCSAKYLLEK